MSGFCRVPGKALGQRSSFNSFTAGMQAVPGLLQALPIQRLEENFGKRIDRQLVSSPTVEGPTWLPATTADFAFQ